MSLNRLSLMADFTVSDESSKTFVRDSPEKNEDKIMKGINWESACYSVEQVREECHMISWEEFNSLSSHKNPRLWCLTAHSILAFFSKIILLKKQYSTLSLKIASLPSQGSTNSSKVKKSYQKMRMESLKVKWIYRCSQQNKGGWALFWSYQQNVSLDFLCSQFQRASQ